jgi:thiosulfate dehydrogenase [quinone] large subunit
MTAATHGQSHPVPASRTATRTVSAAVAGRYVLAGLRIGLGWIFLWAFLDKLFGLGHDTSGAGAWIHGGSPTKGFLSSGATGPFTGFYHGIAGAGWADWLFMVGLAGIGLALLTGIGMRIGAIAGAVMLMMMWSVALPPANNPFLDDHVIYAALLIALMLLNVGDTLGLGRWWSRTTLVRRLPWLR